MAISYSWRASNTSWTPTGESWAAATSEPLTTRLVASPSAAGRAGALTLICLRRLGRSSPASGLRARGGVWPRPTQVRDGVWPLCGPSPGNTSSTWPSSPPLDRRLRAAGDDRRQRRAPCGGADSGDGRQCSGRPPTRLHRESKGHTAQREQSFIARMQGKILQKHTVVHLLHANEGTVNGATKCPLNYIENSAPLTRQRKQDFVFCGQHSLHVCTSVQMFRISKEKTLKNKHKHSLCKHY